MRVGDHVAGAASTVPPATVPFLVSVTWVRCSTVHRGRGGDRSGLGAVGRHGVVDEAIAAAVRVDVVLRHRVACGVLPGLAGVQNCCRGWSPTLKPSESRRKLLTDGSVTVMPVRFTSPTLAIVIA